jgi:uncharacterized cysteine cluster protein YcgN (CxxCxxCC family)
MIENKPLFDWHPLISGDVNSVHLAGISVRGRTYRDDEIPQEEVQCLPKIGSSILRL